MIFSVEFPEDLIQRLTANARAEHLTPELWIQRVAVAALNASGGANPVDLPLRSESASVRAVRLYLAAQACTAPALEDRSRSVTEITRSLPPPGFTSISVRGALERLISAGQVTRGAWRRTHTAPAQGYAITLSGVVRALELLPVTSTGPEAEDRFVLAALIEEIQAGRVRL